MKTAALTAFLAGIAGIAGAIENNTSIAPALIITITAGITLYKIAKKEGFIEEKKNRNSRNHCADYPAALERMRKGA